MCRDGDRYPEALSAMAFASAYIVSARRSALGRVGGLHRNRRLVELAAPVLVAAIEDAGLKATEVEELIVGNASEGGNPARLIGLTAGLADTSSAYTIDRSCASGLDAILAAARTVGNGEAEVVLAGGGSALSTAPWRIGRPAELHQLPRFLGAELEDEHPVEAMERLLRKLGISRMRQDTLVFQAHMRAEAARTAKRFVGEIVPIRANAEEARDQSAVEPSLEELAKLPTFVPGTGTLTRGNSSAPHDGAAFVAIVSERVWTRLGKPPALRLLAAAAHGVSPEDEGLAPIAALSKALARAALKPRDISRIEVSESSAAQVLALAQSLDVDESVINPDGGAVVRGHPGAAAGAVIAVRLFTGLIRAKAGAGSRRGAVALGAAGGLGVAAIFEAVSDKP
jgi:acetyl-CoA C-acetyltransferase